MSWFVHARLSELKRLAARAIREREEHAEEASCGEMSDGEISDIRTDVSADDTTERPAEPPEDQRRPLQEIEDFR